MEIKLNYTQEELSTLLDALNNGYIALSDAFIAAMLACDYPAKLHPLLEDKTPGEVREMAHLRLGALKQLYELLLSYEEKHLRALYNGYYT